MYYTIYKITNQIDGKIYIGSHKTRNLNDNYMGSGKYLKYAIAKYGIENFTKQILFVFDTPELMYAKEAELVNEEFISTENTYNLKVGGFGGFDYLNNSALFDNPTHNPEHLRKISKMGSDARVEALRERFLDDEYRIQHGKESSSRQIKQYAAGRVPGMLGKQHTEESKQKISVANSQKQSGDKNSQYGSRWITDGAKNKKIKKTDSIPKGWVLGRKF